MTHKFNSALEHLETIEDALNYVPALLLIVSKMPEDICFEVKEFTDQLIKSNKELVQLRYLEDITQKERDILLSIGQSLEVIEQIDFDDQLELEMAPEVVRSIKEKTNRLLNRVRKEVTGANLAFPADTPKTSQPIPSTETLLSEAFQEFVSERTAGRSWEPKTKQSYLATFDIFTGLFGDVPITSVDAKLCRSFKSSVQKLPKNHSKISKYKNKPVSRLVQLKLPQQQLISTESVNKHIGRISSFLGWSKQQGYIDSNPMEGMSIRVNKDQIEKRQPFTIEDLNELFDDPIFRECKFKHSYYFWLPIIALYTGARIQEICQLELKDIYELEGILVIDINDNSDQKRLKNKQSARLIPVHQRLIDLGFNRLISRRKRYKHKHLFPELHKKKPQRDGQSQPASKWFARYKARHGFEVNGVKAFHSFRHTFIEELKNKGVPEHVTASLAGHGHQQITYSVYGGKTSIHLLKEHLDRVEFKGLRLDSIQWLVK